MINVSDYKRIYNVAECAGVQDDVIGNTTASKDTYDKIAEWVNTDEYLSSIFTAEVTTIVETTSGQRYNVILRTKWGCGLVYGSTGNFNSAIGYNNYTSYYYTSAGATSYSTSGKLYYTIPLTDLRLMVIESPYGIITDFYDAKYTTTYQINMILSTGKDNADTERNIGIFPYNNSAIRYETDGITASSSNYTLKTRSTSAKTGLFTYMVEGSELVCENLRLCDGAEIGSQSFFEIDGQVWCSIRRDSNYVGFALRIA